MKRHLLLGTGIACLALLVLADTAPAQLRGGRGIGSFGRGGWGGFSPGYSSWGGYHPSYGYSGWGNYGYSPAYGYGHSGWGTNGYSPSYGYSGWGQNAWNQGYASPGFNTFNYGTTTGNSYGTPSLNPAYAGFADHNQQYQSFYQGPGQQNPNAATIHIRVPAPDARVLLDGQPTQAQGMERVFVSPPLDPNARYQYTVRATWNENGRPVSREKTVPVQAGQVATVSFADGQDQSPGRLNDQQPNRQDQGPGRLNDQQPNRQPLQAPAANPRQDDRFNDPAPNRQQPLSSPANPRQDRPEARPADQPNRPTSPAPDTNRNQNNTPRPPQD